MENPPNAEWELHKDTIRRLYVEEDMPIARLIETMETEHGFHASRRKYLYRIKQWGLGRNIRAEVMIRVAMIRETRRKRQGKRTEFVYHGREVDERKIERFIRSHHPGENLCELHLDNSTPPGLTYATPFSAPTPAGGASSPDGGVFDLSGQALPDQEMPLVVIWMLGAFRPLQYHELGIACTVMDALPLWPDFQLPSQEQISARSLGVIQFDLSGAVTHSSAAADVLTTFVPTEDADRLILDTLLKGITRREYLASHFERPLAGSRFQSLSPADLQAHGWCGFMQYATLYWPTHLRRIREPLSLDMEAALNLLLAPPICLTWIEALAVFTGQSFHTSLGRVLGLVADFCSIGGALVTPETLESLLRWIKSGHELLSGWANILERFPSEIHHIEPLFLSDDSSFRREPHDGSQWAIPACTPLKRLPKRSVFDDAAARSIESDPIHCILDEPKNRMYITKQRRTRYSSSWFGGRKDKCDLRSWSIGCFALDTGVEIARFRGQTPFECVGSSWRGYGTVTTQLALANDSAYLAYEEHLHPDQSTRQYTFTYHWRLRDFATVDDDYFGPCTMINRGVPFSSSPRSIEMLRFFPDNTTLQHFDGRYDVENQRPVDSSGPFTKHGPFAKYGDILLAHSSLDGSTLSIIRSMNGGGRLLEVWNWTGDGILMTLSRVFKTANIRILAASFSGRFLAFTHGASTAEAESSPLPEFDDDTESESANESDSFPRAKNLHSCRVLDTQSGNENELFSYRDDTWNAHNDHVTPLPPKQAFFGQLEPDATLLIVRPANGRGPPEGRIWRRSQSGWTNIGHITFDWACAALKFTSDDSQILGIRGNGLYSVRTDSLREKVAAVDTAAVRQESERQRSCWADSLLFYLNSDMPSGVAHKISGYVWDFSGQHAPVALGDEFSFASPVGLSAVKEFWLPSPYNRIYFTVRGEPGCFQSPISRHSAVDGDPDDFYHFIHGRVAAVASSGRYVLTASFMRGGNAIGRSDMEKHLRLHVYEGGSTSALRSFSFEAHWSAVDERNTYYDHYRGVEATFHPTLPIMAWTFSWFNFGFWLADFREDSRPIFIEESRSSSFSLSFSPCGRYFWALRTGALILLDLESGTRCDYTWSEELIRNYHAYSFCGSSYLFVVGFQEEYLLTVLAIPLTTETSPLRLHLLTIPEKYRYLDTVQYCCVQDDGRLRALITESPDHLLKSDGPRSIVVSFDMLSHWEDASALITRRVSIAGPHIDASQGFLNLPPNAQLPVQTLRAKVESEKHWRCRNWSIVDAQGNVLLERKYRWA